MFATKMMIGALALLTASAACAVGAIPAGVSIPIEGGGLLSLIALCLAVGANVVRRKKK